MICAENASKGYSKYIQLIYIKRNKGKVYFGCKNDRSFNPFSSLCKKKQINFNFFIILVLKLISEKKEWLFRNSQSPGNNYYINKEI